MYSDVCREELSFCAVFVLYVYYSRGNRSVPKIVDQFMCSCLTVPRINSSYFEEVP